MSYHLRMRTELRIFIGAKKGTLYKQAALAFAASSGYRLEASPAASPRTLVDEIGESKPDVVLLDVATPAMSGTQIVERIRATVPGVHVIYCTTSQLLKKKRSLVSQADEVVVEPFDADELRFRVDKVAIAVNRNIAPRRTAARRARTVPLVSELHDPTTGRVDTKKVARYLGLSLKSVAGALGKDYKGVFKTPASESLQPLLAPFHRAIVALDRYFGDRRQSLAWLNTPNHDLDEKRPKDLLLAGKGEIVADMLQGALAGVTS